MCERCDRVSRSVGEFKGEKYGHGDVAGTVRFVQASEEVVLVEISEWVASERASGGDGARVW